MIIYCENNYRNGTVLFDSHVDCDLQEFFGKITQNSINLYNERDDRTMIEISGIPNSGKGLREDKFYNIPDEFWNNGVFYFESESGSNLIVARFEYNGLDIDFSSYQVRN